MKTTNNKNGNKRKKSTYRQGREMDSKILNKDLESTRNDASWYAESPQLLRDAASFPYGWAVGAPFDLTDEPDVDLQSVPGVFALQVRPTIGYSKDNFSAANIAARNIYSYVRHANSGHSNYDAPDLMMYLIGMDSIYSMFSYLKRIYGVARLYTQVNRYYPRAILQAMKVDPDSVMMNLADLRYFINQYAIKIGSMCVPSSMSYFTRHMWMYEGMYVDDDSRKAQTYLFVPEGFYMFDEYSGAGKLNFTQIPPVLNSISDIVSIAQNMIDRVLGSEDMNIMSGDILKAYGDGGVFKVSGIGEDYIVLPTYNEEVLSQIQNASIIPAGYVGSTAISQSTETGAIIFQPKMTISVANSGNSSQLYGAFLRMFGHKKFVNMYKDEVTPADTMVATRLQAIVSTVTIPTEPASDGRLWLSAEFSHLGSEIVTGAKYYKFAPGTSGLEITEFDVEAVNIIQYNTEAPATGFTQLLQSINKVVRYAADVSNFKFHPAYHTLKVAFTNTGITSVDYGKPVMDLNNYTIINEADLGRMHETALLSEFSCPQMGAFSNKLL